MDFLIYGFATDSFQFAIILTVKRSQARIQSPGPTAPFYLYVRYDCQAHWLSCVKPDLAAHHLNSATPHHNLSKPNFQLS